MADISLQSKIRKWRLENSTYRIYHQCAQLTVSNIQVSLLLHGR